MLETKAEKFTTSKKVNLAFCLPDFSVTKIVMQKFHVNESNNGRYDMIIGKDLLTALGLDLKFYDSVIIGVEGPYKGCLSPMVDISNYDFKSITDTTI